ncbi:50S ribosomal protein L14 [Candidatus Woesearchaeota archaeon]|jgi:large subunit ribosomal protein L14|nr:50S ribosomal protein L14 [Candidatus Woesearchaeota archaeon]MBT3537438.1 50S ribosomal protein L14 [Candidatus Woesearchaeota archaeon]MBT4697761.1 50S ribosomal protein L14 [Candidatus Woesearchaeota archaeon]MBT4717552.1 50S ribosomal protein L14 [Candidatus Woesearchaeota archaeon]MBT7106252.1 50S ribosomal protein L14 [Candidatus Woesearchaeota archaeon]
MKAIKANVTKGLQVGSWVPTCDNSGAKILKVFAVKRAKTVKRRTPGCGVGDLVMASVKSGKPDMRKKVVFAIIVRQKKEYKRPDGTRVKFEDNAAVVLKDDKGNPKGTIFKGPVAKEAASRWPAVAKIANTLI